jgi:hypothetical protein
LGENQPAAAPFAGKLDDGAVEAYDDTVDKIISKRKLSESGDSFVPGTAAERIAMVWPLTVEAYSLSGKYDVEQRLQRHIVRLVRRKG